MLGAAGRQYALILGSVQPLGFPRFSEKALNLILLKMECITVWRVTATPVSEKKELETVKKSDFFTKMLSPFKIIKNN